jgi:hypothetical protein
MQSSHIRGGVLATVVVLLFGTGTATTSASPPIPPVPAPTIAPAPPQEDGPTATITFADATQIKTQASNLGRFQLVGLHPREVVGIALDFSAGLVSASVTAQPRWRKEFCVKEKRRVYLDLFNHKQKGDTPYASP